MAQSSQSSNSASEKTTTRARSEKIIASLDRVKDRAALEEFLKSPNKHLQARAAYKLAEPAERAGMTAAKNAKKTPA
jgi:hypothetical protein